MVAMNNRERCLGMGGRLGVEKKSGLVWRVGERSNVYLQGRVLVWRVGERSKCLSPGRVSGLVLPVI